MPEHVTKTRIQMKDVQKKRTFPLESVEDSSLSAKKLYKLVSAYIKNRSVN